MTNRAGIENFRERPESSTGLLRSIVKDVTWRNRTYRPCFHVVPSFLARMLLCLQERQQFGQCLVRYFFRQEVPPRKGLPLTLAARSRQTASPSNNRWTSSCFISMEAPAW